MRQLTQAERYKLQILIDRGVNIALIEPTATGLHKSIMDATQPLREFFKSNSIHDYELQHQGPENKILIKSNIVTNEGIFGSKASLYRPKTKTGDPRIWFSGLSRYCSPNDIIGIAYFQGELWVFDLTSLDIDNLISTRNHIKDLVDSYQHDKGAIAFELLGKLKQIAAKGYIPATVDADTAVGRLLEKELNIPINSSKNPDYKGIEIKSFRAKRHNRKNLFTKVADWTISECKSSGAMLDAFGYHRDGVKKLYCTVNSQGFNSQGLMLRVDERKGILAEFSQDNHSKNMLAWRMELLNQTLLEKHAETFWVEADSRKIDGKEQLQFSYVEHTQGPIVTQFGILLNSGDITLDHLIKKDALSVNEKGPSFKLKHNSLALLFPPSQEYSLVNQ